MNETQNGRPPTTQTRKHSGESRLGGVPKHWETRRLKGVCLFEYEDSLAEDYRTNTGFPVYGSNGLIGHTLAPNTERECLIIGRKGSSGKVLYSEEPAFAIDTTFFVDRRHTGANIRWLYYLLTSLNLESLSGDVGVPGLSRARAYQQACSYPPLEEQAAIVRFLDHADEQIQRYIAGKERLIALLEEERQALVHQAVTRGLDPNVRLKPSGVEWLGDVPEQWDISRVKNEFYSLNHQRIPLSATERRTMSIRHYDYYGASGVIDKVEGYLFKDELLLIAEDGANLVLRNLPLAIIARGKFWVNNHAHILKPRRGNLEFLAGLLEGIDYKPWISGAAQPKLTQDRLMSIAIAVPPKEQQDQIMDRTSKETASIQTAINCARRQTALMEEYRTRLIADVVTGKLDVREAAEELPMPEPAKITG